MKTIAGCAVGVLSMLNPGEVSDHGHVIANSIRQNILSCNCCDGART